MLRTTWLRGRRGAAIGASTAVVCLGGGILAGCAGSAGSEGYVAVGPAGGTPLASGAAVAPTGNVTLVPLDGPAGSKAGRSPASVRATAPPAGIGSPSAPASGPGGTPTTTSPSPGVGITSPPAQGTTPPPATGASPAPSPTPTAPGPSPTGAAALTVGKPERQAADQRWCEKVTVSFRNTGGVAVRSGTVTLGTHVIDALGIDWATVKSTQALPAPIAAGASVKGAWTVCVDAWRVPLGMHIETRDVSAQWR